MPELAATVAEVLALIVTVFSVLKTNCVSTLLDESFNVFVPKAENAKLISYC